MRRFIISITVAAGIAVGVGAEAGSAPAHASTPTICQQDGFATFAWGADGYQSIDLGYYLVSVDSTGSYADIPSIKSEASYYCQEGEGYSDGGFTWFRYEEVDVNTNTLSGECLTVNASNHAEVWMQPCSLIAAQEWTTTDQNNCQNSSEGYGCWWLVGNAYYYNQSCACALTDLGQLSTPEELTWGGSGDTEQQWFGDLVLAA